MNWLLLVVSFWQCSYCLAYHWYRRPLEDGKMWNNSLGIMGLSRLRCAVISEERGLPMFIFNPEMKECYAVEHDEMLISGSPNNQFYSLSFLAPISSALSPSTATPSTAITTTNNTPSCSHLIYSVLKTPVRWICYRIFYEGKTWTDARHTCQNDGGDLLIMEDPNMLSSFSFSQSDVFYIGIYNDDSIPSAKYILVDNRTDSTFEIPSEFWRISPPYLNDWCGCLLQDPSQFFWSGCTFSHKFICEIQIIYE